MEFYVHKGPLQEVDADAIVVGHFKGHDHLIAGAETLDAALNGHLRIMLTQAAFEGEAGEIVSLEAGEKIPCRQVIVVGLGREEGDSADKLKLAAASVVQRTRALNAQRVAFFFQDSAFPAVNMQRCAERVLGETERTAGDFAPIEDSLKTLELAIPEASLAAGSESSAPDASGRSCPPRSHESPSPTTSVPRNDYLAKPLLESIMTTSSQNSPAAAGTAAQSEVVPPDAALSSASRRFLIPAAFLAVLTAAELLTALASPVFGLILHVMLLVALLAQATLDPDPRRQKLYVGLSFGPLIRLISLTLPLGSFPLAYWYLITSVPLLAAAWMMMRTKGLSWQYAGLTLRWLPLQIPICAIGLALGYMEYRILQPAPLATGFTWEQIWLPALILLVCTGFLEEFIFRGLMQSAAREVLGPFGLVYVAAVFAVLHLGYKSLADVVFVFAVGLIFGVIVAKTGSILGVTLAHGLTNITLFLIMPFVSLSGPLSIPLAQLSPAPAEKAVIQVVGWETEPAAPAEAYSLVAIPDLAATTGSLRHWYSGIEQKKSLPARGSDLGSRQT